MSTYLTLRDFGIRVSDSARGNVKTLCPKCSADRKKKTDPCLSVNVDDGVWNCHNCGWRGSLKENRPEREWKTVPPKSMQPSPKKIDYFASRGIPRDVVERNGITEDGRNICFNYFVGDKLVNIKYRDAAKKFRQEPDATPVAYKLNDIREVSECIVTEGEIDALSFEVAGFPNAVSVPNGAINEQDKATTGKLRFLDNCGEYFDRMDTIYLATDNDAAGVRLRDELARRFDARRCMIVHFPHGCKDANEVLVRYGAAALAECIDSAEPYPVDGVLSPSAILDELFSFRELGGAAGLKIGIGVLDNLLTWARPQLTIVTGIPNHGKSVVVDYVTVRLMALHGWRWAYFTPEHHPIRKHLRRLVEQLVGKPLVRAYHGAMTDDEVREAVAFLNNHARYITPTDDVYTFDKLFVELEYLVRRFGIDGFVVDPWNFFEHQMEPGETETRYINRQLNRLRQFIRRHNLHGIVVAHPTKLRKDPMGEAPVPTLYDISGSAHFYNIADNGMVIYRRREPDTMKDIHTEIHIAKVKDDDIGTAGVANLFYEVSNKRYDFMALQNRESLIPKQGAKPEVPIQGALPQPSLPAAQWSPELLNAEPF